jgi:hypothetical protein
LHIFFCFYKRQRELYHFASAQIKAWQLMDRLFWLLFGWWLDKELGKFSRRGVQSSEQVRLEHIYRNLFWLSKQEGRTLVIMLCIVLTQICNHQYHQSGMISCRKVNNLTTYSAMVSLPRTTSARFPAKRLRLELR